MEILKALKDTPLPTILVVAGIVFLLLAIADQLVGKIAVPPERQRQATIIGCLLLMVGIALHVAPLLGIPPTPSDVKPVLSPGKKEPSSPSQTPPSTLIWETGSVEPYRIFSYSVGDNTVEFSISINNVPVGSYSSSFVTADITRFIKAGENQVHIAWTADPKMVSRGFALVEIQVKQGDDWSSIITRKVTKDTQAGESTARLQARVAPQ